MMGAVQYLGFSQTSFTWMWPLAIYPSMMACWPAESLSFTLGVLASSSHRYLKSCSPQGLLEDMRIISAVFWRLAISF